MSNNIQKSINQLPNAPSAYGRGSPPWRNRLPALPTCLRQAGGKAGRGERRQRQFLPDTTLITGILTFIMFAGSGAARAQYHDELMFGLRVGGNYSQITNLTNVLINDENKPMYEFSEKTTYSPAVSLFSHYRFQETQIALEGALNYNQIAVDVDKNSLVSESKETFNFHYQYLGFGLYTKVYLYRGLMVGVGTNMGFCLNSSSGIAYQSSTGSLAQDMQSEEHIRQALKGRANVSGGAVLGYEFRFGLSVQASYLYGFTDLMETGVNPYKFSEARNNARTLQVAVSWAVSRKGFY